MTVGYSGTPLPKKLGIHPGSRVLTISAPEGLESWLSPLPEGATLSSRIRSADLAVVFAVTEADMRRRVPRATAAVPADGAIWLCWPKKASGIDSPLQRRDVVMDYMTTLGLVDVKVAAVSETWSGLKWVVRRELR